MALSFKPIGQPTAPAGANPTLRCNDPELGATWSLTGRDLNGTHLLLLVGHRLSNPASVAGLLTYCEWSPTGWMPLQGPTWSTQMVVPNDPGLSGLTLVVQGITAGVGGLQSTNGMEVTLGY